MIIFPALARFATSTGRGFGSPRALRCRRVKGFSTGRGSGSGSGGGVPGRGDDATEEDRVEVEDLGVESSGVDSSGSSTSIAFDSCCNCVSGVGSFRALRVLFATESDTEEIPDDSSNVRLGDRWTRRTKACEESTFAGCEATGVGGNTSTSIWGGDAAEDRGDGERDIGRGICVGVGIVISSTFTFVLANWPFLVR